MCSCMNIVYLIISNHLGQIFKFLSNLYIDTNGNGTNLLTQL